MLLFLLSKNERSNPIDPTLQWISLNELDDDDDGNDGKKEDDDDRDEDDVALTNRGACSIEANFPLLLRIVLVLLVEKGLVVLQDECIIDESVGTAFIDIIIIVVDVIVVVVIPVADRASTQIFRDI
jgi:hypothetical protein